MEHIDLLCNISELNWVFSDSSGIEDFLRKTVVMTARHMHADVCSIYLYDSSSETLVLKATYGLNTGQINHVKLKLGEGLTGLALKELRYICERHGSRHPNYKFFSALHEDTFDAFLAVPITRGIEKIGVLVVQRKQGHDFSETDISALSAVTSQLANIIENARLLISLKEAHGSEQAAAKPPADLKMLKGKPASAGFALGPVKIEMKFRTLESLASRAVTVHHGLDAFNKAVSRTRTRLTERQRAIEARLSDAASLIFTAHLMLLQDELFYGRIVNLINGGTSAERAILETARYYITFFSSNENQHFREKADDIRDLSIRLLENLPGFERHHSFYDGRVVIARELLPSDILVLSSENVAGIVLIAGGVTSHLSVLARSLDLPLIIADESRLLALSDETILLLDGETGNVYINPDREITGNFEKRNRARLQKKSLKEEPAEKTFTSDGTKVTILANINLLTDIKAAAEFKCEGVGLYRTEFPFMIRSAFPSEEEQVVVYRKLVEGMKGKPVTFRTLDIGGDKVLSYYDHLTEQNPFLGLRSIRFTLRNSDIFRRQVRAILRAGHDADLRIMFPMITTVEEFTDARAMVAACVTELGNENALFNRKPLIGIMIEIPAVVEIIDTLAGMVDFFSIGTNDFVQYMLAVDRTNEKVAPLYLPHHPAVLRALARVAKSAAEHDTPISVCGDMAHQTEYLPFLLGIGIRIFSVDAMYIYGIQKCVAGISIGDAENTVATVLNESSEAVIARILGIRD